MNYQDEWDRNPNGTFQHHPLTGFQSSVGGLALVWRVEWAEARGAKRPRARSVQVSVPIEDARRIAERILESCDAHLPGLPKGSA
ncbi:hypothetical protein SZ64_04545 [Erythrobacter sp. SG61-1L]|uniref:hypothetical protein n=1 Tax=Erythrobacter sp. SG61-1L TaxID=1603897 RepID=UPI0006C938A0|nr:hypothetical protein [Erythrobacter sp. SG61-1L]KPL67436.1 hypothetical protein SZ64_04545 [Erythrobacter sp. SG61-1L]